MDDAGGLVLIGGRVGARDGATEKDGVTSADELVEHIQTPLRVVAKQQFGLGMTSTYEAPSNTDSVCLSRSSHRDRCRVKSETYGT